MASETCLICFEDYLVKNTKDHQCKEQNLCGACGQYYEENQQGEDGYHAPELCDANDEICEDCDNGTDMPCISCQSEELKNAYDPALNCECGYQH